MQAALCAGEVESRPSRHEGVAVAALCCDVDLALLAAWHVLELNLDAVRR